MRLPARPRPAPAAPGTTGTLRHDRRTATLVSRLRPGDVAVLDHLDLDRATARRLLDAGVVGVVNAGPFISGRYPNLGPELLCEAGVALVDGVGQDGLAALAALGEGTSVRLHEGRVLSGDRVVATGRPVEPSTIREDLALARLGMATQLETFTHDASEFLRREHDLLLNGVGLPRLTTPTSGRPVVVVVDGPEARAELEQVLPYLREQQPVLVAVDAAVELLREHRLRPDVLILDAEAEPPPTAVLTAARDVVLRLDPGGDRARAEQLERLGVRPGLVESRATAEDAALLLADAGHAAVIVGVGLHATLVDFLDRQRGGLSSTYLTRLKVGPRLVDASAVPRLYSGRVRPRHLLAVMLAGLLALVAAVSVTPVGQEWADQAATALSDLLDTLQGLL